MSFKCGDHVYASDWAEGTIVKIFPEDCEALVEFTTCNGGGCLPFAFEEMELIQERVATMEVFKSVHGTVHVVTQNCTTHVNDFLSLFDVWNSHGNYKYDECKPNERAKIWFECKTEFVDFIESDIGRAALQRLGVKKLEVRE